MKTNFSKCEIAGLSYLKGVLEAVCKLKSINITTGTIKILGVHISYNGNLKVQNNFLDTAETIQEMLRFWNSRMLSSEGRLIIFKILASSKIVYLTFLTVISSSSVEELRKTKKCLYGTSHVQKLFSKHYVTILKMVD